MITVVSGLPRSGTSLMMQILKVNGFEILTDNIRTADENNPNGYYEYEKVKSLMKDNSWLSEAEGKAVKIIAQLLFYLPQSFNYKIIFMHRSIKEILASQSKMLERSGSTKRVSADLLTKTFLAQEEKSINWIEAQSNIDYVNISFENLFVNPEDEIQKLVDFQKGNIDLAESLNVIESNLYRVKIV